MYFASKQTTDTNLFGSLSLAYKIFFMKKMGLLASLQLSVAASGRKQRDLYHNKS